MRRREFIAGLGGAAVWPLAARAQQGNRVRRIGVLIPAAADDPEQLARIATFHQGLQEAGWTVGRNVQIDYRWTAGNFGRLRTYAGELVALGPDVILAQGGTAVAALQQASRSIPIVFAVVVDPVGAGLVSNLARPGSNTTGFMDNEYGTSGKWVELLKQVAPRVTRVAVMRDPAVATGIGQFAAIQSTAAALGVEATALIVRDASEIESGISGFARGSNGGLVVTASSLTVVHRELIIALAARLQLPATYPGRYFVVSGGLISYGPDRIEHYRRAAGYVDRILRGEKPGDLPVQTPTKFELVINLKTTKALGLTIPETLLATADEVIQ